jgi:preprotein translocase subunit SecB
MKSPKQIPLTPLKASPLSIIHHEFVQIQLEAALGEQIRDEMSIRTSRQVQMIPDEPQKWIVELAVLFGDLDEQHALPAKYSGQIKVRGLFQVSEQYPTEERSKLMEITACSILYGACREMLANLTARSANGMVSLPSVTFTAFQQQPAKKTLSRSKKPKASKM